MNRVEYANAIRDLLALDVDPSTLLPADDSSHGFDNIADVLGVSPSLLERYVVRGGEDQPARRRRTRSGAAAGHLHGQRRSQSEPDARRPAARHARRHGRSATTSRVDGEYLIKLSLLEAQFRSGVRRGRRRRRARGDAERPAREAVQARRSADVLHARVAGLASGEAAADRSARGAGEDDARHPPRVPAEGEGGPQTIGVAFLQKSHAANEDLVQRPVSSTYDVNIGMQYGYTTVPHLVARRYHRAVQRDRPRRHAEPPAVFVCRPSVAADETPCARQIVSTLVRPRVRRAPTDADVDPLLRVLSGGARTAPAASRPGSRWRCAASSPIRSSSSASSRRRPASHPETPYRISDIELASRLSFFLWSSIPGR